MQAEEEKVPEKRAAPEEIKETPIVAEAAASQQEEQKCGVSDVVYEAPIEDKKSAEETPSDAPSQSALSAEQLTRTLNDLTEKLS